MKQKESKAYIKPALILPLLLILIFMVIMVSYTSSALYRSSVSTLKEVGADKVTGIASRLENYLYTAKSVLWVTADSVEHLTRNSATPEQILEYLTEQSAKQAEQFDESYTGIYGYIMGEYLDGVGWTPPEGFDPTTRDWYQTAMEARGESAIVSPYVDAQTKKVIISVSRMLPNGTDVLSLDLTLDHIQDLAYELKLKGKGYGFVVDRTGLVIAHTDERFKGTYINSTVEERGFLRKIINTSDSSFEYSLDGMESTVFSKEIMDQWYAVIVISDKELYREIWSQLAVNILFCTIIFIMIVVFYFLGYRNELKYSSQMEKMRLDEQGREYERRVLLLEKDAADNANRAKSSFLASMSHEIRTPMNAIIGMDEMILRECKETRIKKYALDIQSAGKTLLSIINDILDFSKIESGKLQLSPVSYEVSPLLNDVANMTLKKAEEKGLTFQMNISPDIPSVLFGDEIRIRQIMLNLINNAVKYTHSGGVTADISFRKDDNKLVIRVEDTGIGIRPEDMDRLFESFTRLEENRNRTIEGTGLGLNITSRLVDMMNGKIDVESEYGRGSVFTAEVTQEVIDETPIEDFVKNLAKIHAEKEEYAPSLVAPKARILVVDDNDMNLTVITSLLKNTKIKLKTAESGRECLDLLKKEHFDVIMLDQMMPEMSGDETLKIIRDEHLCDGTPVIALTADAIVGARESYIQKGFTDYLSKPVVFKELERLLMIYLDKKLLVFDDDGSSVPEEVPEEEKPLVLVISNSPDKLREMKAVLGSSCKGVYVKNKETAEKYLSKH